MASLSREKSLKWNSSIPNSLLRGILAAWESRQKGFLGELTEGNNETQQQCSSCQDQIYSIFELNSTN